MRLDEITRSESGTMAILTSAGWSLSGVGAHGSVYVHPDRDYAIKVFKKTDHAYMAYLEFLKRKQSPHYPKMRGKPMSINDKLMGVRIERLTPSSIGELADYGNGYDERSSKYLDGNPSLRDALIAISVSVIRRSEGSIRFDLHKSNIMMRGDTVVLVDPVANS